MFRDGGGSIGRSEINEAVLFTVEEGRVIFSKPGYADFIEALDKVVGVQKDIYEALYLPLLYRYAEFVQSLEMPRDNQRTCMIDRSLRRSFGFVRQCAPKVFANNGFGFDPDRLIFALFSAALLNGIGRMCQDRQIVLCNNQGHFVKMWFPTTGCMQGDFYKVRATKSQDEQYVEQMHMLYAQVVMPEVGLAWILEDQALFLMWKAALADMHAGFDKLDIDLDVEKLAKGVGEDMAFEKDVQTIIPPDTLDGEKFLAWLKAMIAKDSALINKDGSGLHHVNDGLLLELDILIEGYLKSGQAGSATALGVAEQFSQLGVAGVTSSYSKSQGSSFLGQSNQKSFEAAMIDYEKGLFESAALGPVSQVASLSQVTSGERFFTRIGGIAQQFNIAYSSSKT